MYYVKWQKGLHLELTLHEIKKFLHGDERRGKKEGTEGREGRREEKGKEAKKGEKGEGKKEKQKEKQAA